MNAGERRDPENGRTAGDDPARTPFDVEGRTEAQPEDAARQARHRSASDPELPPLEQTEGQPVSKVVQAQLRSKGPPEVPGYRVLEPLGAGSYGEVWLAEETRTGIRVAIKFFAHGTGQQWLLLQAEVRQLAQLHADPGIVQLLDVGPDADPPYYVMAFAEGGSLAKRLEQGPLAVDEALGIFRQAAEALAYVHAKGVRHCDLKPGNILLDARGRALLADFGQAHLSDDASPALGTFFYMAPEQADLNHQVPDTRWDVYGLGALFYAMLTSRPPRQEETLQRELAGTAVLAHRLERYRNRVRSAPKPEAHRRVAGMDRQLADVIDRCLEIDPDKRLRDAGAVLAALARRRAYRRQRPLLIFGVLAPLLLVLTMAVLTLWGAGSSISDARTALTAQLQESDLVSARLIANAVQDQLRERRKVAEARAENADLVRAVRAGDRAAASAVLARFLKGSNGMFASWCVADRDGMTLALEPFDPFPEKSYSYRDWFNGLGDQPERPGNPYPPIEHTHVSQPFVSTASKQNMVISVAAPVREDGQTIGVLIGSVELAELNSWVTEVEIRDGFVALFNERGQCLLHRAREQILPRPGQNPRSWLDATPTYQDLLGARKADKAVLADPIDGKTYLASYAPMPDAEIGWGVIVQHDKAAAQQPIDDLWNGVIVSGVVTTVTVGLVISALWAWLIWLLWRKERLAYA